MPSKRRRLVVSLFSISVAMVLNATAQAAPRMVRVAVLSGQSNMAGGTTMVARTAWPQAWFDDSSAIGVANSAWGGLKSVAEGGDGIQAGVAAQMQALFPDDQIAILKVSQAATGISYWMTPNDSSSKGYIALTERIPAAVARLVAQQAAGEIAGFSFEGFFWMQGEHEMDPWNTVATNKYFHDLKELTSLVRGLTNTPALPVILGRTGSIFAPSAIRANYGNYRTYPVTKLPSDPGYRPYAADSEFINSPVLRGHAYYEGYTDSVRTAQVGWTLYDGHSAWVDVDDLPTVDYYHYPTGSPGKVTIGERMGRALGRLKGAVVADELKLDAGPHRWAHPGTFPLAAAVVSGPANPTSVQWTLVAATASVTIESPNSLMTNVTITEPGTYSFQATAIDGGLRHAATVNIYVLPEGVNLPAYGSSPVFYAPRPGAPVMLVPNIVNPDSDTLSYAWGQQSTTDPTKRFGYGKMIIDSVTSATPTVRFTWPGVQIVRLQISDGTTRADGNSSGWLNVPVFVGTDGPVFPDYSARWSFNEPTYLLPEMNETKPDQLNVGVTQSLESSVDGGCGVFDGTSYLRNSTGANSWESVLFIRPFTNYSLSLWVNPDAPADGTQVLYEEGGSSQNSSFTLRLHNGHLQAGIYHGGTLYTVETAAPEAGVWTQVAFTYDGAAGIMKLWINGEAVASTAGLPSSIAKRSLASAIGARLQQDAFNAVGGATDAADFFRGKLDEVRLYERTLDETAVLDLYKAGVTVTPGGTVLFAASTASVAENAGSVTLNVRRRLGSAGNATVNFATSNGTATAGSDFTAVSGMLTWADGDSGNKTITVPVQDDLVYTGNRTFLLALSDPSGALSGYPSTSTVTIVEDEPANAAPQIGVVSPTASPVRIPTGAYGILLDTTVTDDGLSGSPVTFAWTTLSGPASAGFSAPGSADTMASFPVAGTYVLRLTAGDGKLAVARDLTVVVGGTPGNSDGPTTGLILRYRFDEGSGTTITDSVGNHTVTGFGNATWSASGKFGGGYDVGLTANRAFSPANQTDLNFSPLADAFTVSTWVKTSSTTAVWSSIFSKNALSGSNLQYRVWSPSSATKLQGNCGNAQSLEYVTSPPAVNDGNWHLVTLVNSNSSGTWKTCVYYDNAIKALEWSTGNGTLADGLLKIGASSTGSNPWSGQIDDFRIYNRALSQTEIGDLYSAEPAGFAPVVSIAAPGSVSVGVPAALDGTVTDDGFPNPPSAVTTLWEKVSGPGNVTFSDASAVDTTVTADAAGTYVFCLRANDGTATGVAQATLTVTAPPGYASWSAGIAWNGAASSPSADPDGDGMENLLECALGGDPLSSASVPGPVEALASDRLQLTFFRASAVLVYSVEGSSDLVTWSDIFYSPGPVGQFQTVTDDVTLTHQPKRFLRLRVGTP